MGDGRYAIPVELQRDRRLYSGTCVFDAEQREARLRNIEEARTFGGGGQFANYADPRRVCAEMAENRGWAVERIGNAQEIGYSRYLVRLRVRNPGHANNSDVIDCTWDARDGRVQLTRS